MLNSLIPNSDITWIGEVDKIVQNFPSRHSEYQIKNFIVCQEQWPPDIQYKQCVRELQVRSKLIKERQFEFKEFCLKTEALRLEIRREQTNRCEAGSLEEDVKKNKIAQIENQINLLNFNRECLISDVADIIRELKILYDLSVKLSGKRKFDNFEEADADYWSNRIK